ncbi:MAG TPA: hypothetical protein VGH89_01995 [Pseudonocardia sp.]
MQFRARRKELRRNRRARARGTAPVVAPEGPTPVRGRYVVVVIGALGVLAATPLVGPRLASVASQVPQEVNSDILARDSSGAVLVPGENDPSTGPDGGHSAPPVGGRPPLAGPNTGSHSGPGSTGQPAAGKPRSTGLTFGAPPHAVPPVHPAGTAPAPRASAPHPQVAPKRAHQLAAHPEQGGRPEVPSRQARGIPGVPSVLSNDPDDLDPDSLDPDGNGFRTDDPGDDSSATGKSSSGKHPGDQDADQPVGDKASSSHHAPAGRAVSADKPTGGKPSADRPVGDKQDADKPSSDKPSGARSAVGKAHAGKPPVKAEDVDRPSGHKPHSGNPPGDKPSANNPDASQPEVDQTNGGQSGDNGANTDLRADRRGHRSKELPDPVATTQPAQGLTPGSSPALSTDQPGVGTPDSGALPNQASTVQSPQLPPTQSSVTQPRSVAQPPAFPQAVPQAQAMPQAQAIPQAQAVPQPPVATQPLTTQAQPQAMAQPQVAAQQLATPGQTVSQQPVPNGATNGATMQSGQQSGQLPAAAAGSSGQSASPLPAGTTGPLSGQTGQLPVSSGYPMPGQTPDMSPLRPVPPPSASMPGPVVLLPPQPADDPSPDPFASSVSGPSSLPAASSRATRPAG